jgi:hypothetical protein
MIQVRLFYSEITPGYGIIGMAEPYKWNLNPEATLRELARSEEDPGYQKTICGIQRMIWMVVNVDLNGYIPEEKLAELNDLLEKSFKMGKRMHYRLREYFKLVNEREPDPPAEEFVSEVLFPDPEPKGDT